ncbi:Cytoplasmic dynein light chain 1, partial [Fasciola gigantica]
MSERKAVVKNADMSDEMQEDAVHTAASAMDRYQVEKDISAFVKKEFDRKYGPTWHCIAGRNFGSFLNDSSLGIT